MVLTTLENVEISGNLLILENSWNLKYTLGIFVYPMLFFFVTQSETHNICAATVVPMSPRFLKIYSGR